MSTSNRTLDSIYGVNFDDTGLFEGIPPPLYPACQLYSSTTLSCEDPASQYLTQKIIQKTVRVPASLYMSDLAALNVYQKPLRVFANVNWNQMSDRKEPHIQPNLVVGGSFYHGSSTRRTITRNRPGAGCPGGKGVDIKHNSYYRYLDRLKGRGPARRGVVPPHFGRPLVFNPAFPIYGGKTMKTNIVTGCDCPIDTPLVDAAQDEQLYETIAPLNFSYTTEFNVGTDVYATNLEGYYVHAVVVSKNGYEYTVQYDDGSTATLSSDKLLVYFPCVCTGYSSLNVTKVLSTGNYFDDGYL
jgi:hypothetical protein